MEKKKRKFEGKTATEKWTCQPGDKTKKKEAKTNPGGGLTKNKKTDRKDRDTTNGMKL